MSSPSSKPSGPFESEVQSARALWLAMWEGKRIGALESPYRQFSAFAQAFDAPSRALEAWRASHINQFNDLFAGEAAKVAIEAASKDAAEWFGETYRVVPYGTRLYPTQLEEISDAPPLLFVEGDVELLQRPGVAIVGTRKASDSGILRARRAAAAVVEAGLAVVSGLAAGIDAAAHTAALDASGFTYAVMGTPVDKRYPISNSALADRIVESGGSLVSEFPPHSATRPWHFLRRNRTMSGLTTATVVIEASETSGAKSQAFAALEHGRPVFLPKSLVDSHDWARNLVESGRGGRRATMVEDADEIGEALTGTAEVMDADIAF